MDERPRVFEILREIPGEAADRALVDGLREVAPAVQSEIIGIVLERDNEAGLAGLPALYHKLSPGVQAQIVSNTSHLFGALRACIHSSSSQTRQNALRIVRRSGSPQLAYLAGSAIHDGSPKIRAEAAATLLELVDRHCRTHTEMTTALRDTVERDGSLFRGIGNTLQLLQDERECLIKVLRNALEHYESHHRSEVLEASMLLAHELEDSLFSQSTIKRGKLTHAMFEIISHSLAPRFVPFLYVAMCYPELRRRIVPKIAACRDIGFFTEFIRWQWLARDPDVGKHLVAIRSIAWLVDGFEAVFSLPNDVAAMAPGWLLLLGLPSDQKIALLTNFLILDHRKANRAAVWALVQINTPNATLTLEGLTDHDDPTIQRIARQELHRRKRAGHLQHRRPARHGRPEAWTAMLDRAGLSEDFADFWQNFEHVQAEQARSVADGVFKFVPGFTSQVQVKLNSKRSSDRLRALRMILALSVCDHFQKDIFTAANDTSPEVRAAAMAALGQIGGETSRRICERALCDRSPLVQAAAIDALDQMRAERRAELVGPKTDSEDADVRAAAVRCLLKMRMQKAAGALITMLQDDRADHRCAALWVVDQLKLATLAPRISEFARSDPDPRIARIGQHVARRLERIRAATVKGRPAEVSA